MGTGRDALLARIMDDVAQHGLGDRSLRELAAAVGTSHRMVLYHFGSRAGLVEAIVLEMEARERVFARDLATTVDTPAELLLAMWNQLISPEVLPFVRLFFEVVAVTSRDHSVDLTSPWLSDVGPIADLLGTTMDADEARASIAVVRGLLIDVVTTGRVEPATRSLEWSVSRLP